ncbi:MAG: rod shape-determining protein MreC [Anaerolineales bacterium]|uniref:Cell shape-determining protein MreC n=1 Tax=Candidatus Desulfolinea nitratireducens TaxID=2841698 RepID=A0A8J6THL3_9CHLR|nr:rod shape-determining protein MreC [Candidatus Desulfolinea nitratireducens]
MKTGFSRSLQTTIIFFVVGGILVLALGGYFSTVSDSFGRSLVSVQTWVSTRYVVIRNFLSAPGDVVSLQQRNAELESEISGLQTQVIQLQQQLTDTQVLAALVDFSQSSPESVYKAAAVIGRDPSPFLHYIIINSGSNDGLRRGMPVVTNQGLIGRVDAVTAEAARVQLATDTASAVNIRLQNADTDAVLVGSVTGDLALEMISQDVDIQEGDVVLTSGLGGDYPPDLLVGQIFNIRKRDYELFQQASVQSTVDFSRLEIVLVIMNFKPIDITPLIPENTP